MINRLPPWFKQEIPKDMESIASRIKALDNLRLNTVCLSARCPNMACCFKKNSTTFMIMGNTCSRNCGFCAVGKGNLRPLDLSEAYNLALGIRSFNLKYAVITSVTRDDLALGGATQFARVAHLVRSINHSIKIESLIPDFKGRKSALSLIVESPVDIIAHNLETVKRFYPKVRPQAKYRLSLSVLEKIKKIGFCGFVKSGIMLGFGESKKEVLRAMRNLRDCGCDILTLGQYLAPSRNHLAVVEFVSPEIFEFYRQEGLRMGFKFISSAPLVRSSFMAEEAYSRLAA